MKKYVFDTECYRNYWLFMAKEIGGDDVVMFEKTPNKPLDRRALMRFVMNNTIVGFNSLNYDIPTLSLALTGVSTETIKELSDALITSDAPAWMTCKSYGIDLITCDHIDINPLCIGMSSLKLYGARLNAKHLQDLPVDPAATITKELRDQLVTYCRNDLDLTELLYKDVEPAVKLRESISERYGIDLRSKSDAQIAEALILSELTKNTGDRPQKPKVDMSAVYGYNDPKIVSFIGDNLRAIFDRIKLERFTLHPTNGNIQLPKWLSDTKIKIGSTTYQMGIGGLHSTEKKQAIKVEQNQLLRDADVTSFYPSIILQQQLAPKQLGKPFLELYQNIVDERVAAKKRDQELSAKIDALEKKLEIGRAHV
jgi:hypothetical protein